MANRPRVSELPLFVVPSIQVLLFCAAVATYPASPGLAIVALLVAALAMCLSLHMSYHEAAHRSARWPAWRRILTGILLTPLLGMSFHAYRVSHWNHHRYNNGLRDFTTTWTLRDGEPRPKNLLWYCLSWPRIFFETSRLFKTALAEGDADARVLTWSSIEGLLLLAWLFALASYSMTALWLYFGLVYAGWTLISLHNYGQHLPVDYDNWYRTTSYAGPWYNRLLFNNGLHYEHHVSPGAPIAELAPDEDAEPVTVPHLLAPFSSRA